MRKKRISTQQAAISLLVCFLSVIVLCFLPTRGYASKTSVPEAQIASKVSLVHLGSIDSSGITAEGIQAAKFVRDFLENNNPNSAKAALQIYKRIIPLENLGGEYTALQWFLEYLLAPDSEKPKFLEDPYAASFYEFFAADNFAQLKEYLNRKYQLEILPDQYSEEGINRRAFLEDFILFNNPRREDWEKTSKIINVLHLKPGDRIADIGSGPGYYTFKFSKLVGDKGRVFAIDTVKNHLDYVAKIAKKYGHDNIEYVQPQDDDHTIGLPANQVDVAFICSLYHIIYVTYSEAAKDQFVGSIESALKPNGRLFVVDNAPVEGDIVPYHGPYMDKDLIIGQLKYYGFQLVNQYEFIPQRYVLEFKKA